VYATSEKRELETIMKNDKKKTKKAETHNYEEIE
jgi:hypothetical protein